MPTSSHLHTRWFALAFVCGCATPTLTTSQGLRVFDKTGMPDRAAQVEQVAAAVAEALGHPERFEGYDVFLVSDWIEIPQMNGGVNRSDGFTNPLDGQVLASVFSDCLYVSGLVHELAHVIHDRPTGVPDWTHDDKGFWTKVETMEADLRARCSEAQLEQDAQARAAAKKDAAPAGADGASAPEPATPVESAAAEGAPAMESSSEAPAAESADAPAEDAPAAPDAEAPAAP